MKSSCDLCQSDIFNKLRVKCEECKDFVICFACFGSTTSFHEHNDGHRVSVDVKALQSSGRWTFDEDFVLLQSVLDSGLGNWSESAALLEKPEKECESRMIARFIPLRTDKDWTALSKFEERNEQAIKDVPAKLFAQSETVGFMPFRTEFATEPDNDAEFIIADCRLDDPALAGIVLDGISIYNSILKERESLKQLVKCDFVHEKKRRRPKTVKEFKEVLAPLARFADSQSEVEVLAFKLEKIETLKELLQQQKKRDVCVEKWVRIKDAVLNRIDTKKFRASLISKLVERSDELATLLNKLESNDGLDRKDFVTLTTNKKEYNINLKIVNEENHLTVYAE